MMKRRRRTTNFPRIKKQVFPPRIMVKLPYFESIRLVDTENIVQTEHIMDLTSAYDPNQTGTGGQPRGYDQWASIYGNYIVRGVAYKIKIRPSSDTAATNVATNFILGVTCGPEGFSSQNFQDLKDYMEYPKSKYHKWQHSTREVNNPREGAMYRGRTDYMSGYVSNKKLLRYYGAKGIMGASVGGQTVYIYPNDYAAPTGTSPASINELCLWAASLPEDGNAFDGGEKYLPYMYADVRLVYYVEFWNPVFPIVS